MPNSSISITPLKQISSVDELWPATKKEIVSVQETWMGGEFLVDGVCHQVFWSCDHRSGISVVEGKRADCFPWVEGDGLMQILLASIRKREKSSPEDQLRKFIEERCVADKDSRVVKNEIYDIYRTWAIGLPKRLVFGRVKFLHEMARNQFDSKAGTQKERAQFMFGIKLK